MAKLADAQALGACGATRGGSTPLDRTKMSLFFVTSNKGKFSELQALIPSVEQLDLDLREIQETDPKKIIQEKIKETFKHTSGEFIVEDTSLTFESLNVLPGPLIKWFLLSIGTAGLVNLVNKLGNNKAEAKTIIGYAKGSNEIQFFEGSLKGTIVNPKGESGFGWDPIFKPEGSDKTFAEMSQEEKNEISHRSIATNKLAEFLNNND